MCTIQWVLIDPNHESGKIEIFFFRLALLNLTARGVVLREFILSKNKNQLMNYV
jgi:hypothetical protein